ncbi:MAG TPA: class I SAM-dependent methyltransferase [Actinomycetota bacterium]|nr:class I SAM-dependent methyltransferase [Actinomycetota bacterium]
MIPKPGVTAESYDREYFRTIPGERQTRFDRARDDRVVALVSRHGPPANGDTWLLDIGCGYGHLLARFRDRYRIAGIDLSDHASGVAREALPGTHVIQADIQRELPFGHRFGVVLAINVIEHLPDPRAAVRRITEALDPGGLCVIHLPTVNGPVSRLIYRFAYAGDPTHVYRPSGREVRRLFEAEGFEMVEGSFAPHTPWLLSGLGWHPAYLAAFRKRQ